VASLARGSYLRGQGFATLACRAMQSGEGITNLEFGVSTGCPLLAHQHKSATGAGSVIMLVADLPVGAQVVLHARSTHGQRRTASALPGAPIHITPQA
jgi:hypothetical protein